MAARTRHVFVCLTVATAVLAAILAHAAAWALDQAALGNPSFIGRQLLLSQLIGYGAAVVIGLACYVRSGPREHLGEVIDELQRVAWPSREETTHATWVVLVCVLISAACLGVFDTIWLQISGFLFGGPSRTG